MFDDEGPFVRASTRALARDFRILGQWGPYPLEIFEDHGDTRAIVWAVAITGILGAAAMFALATFSTYAYPFDSGGRPLFTWQTFLIPSTEFLALTGAIGGVIALFIKAGLTRLHHRAFDLAEVERASRDSFVLALACDTGDSANAAVALLAEAGAFHTRVVE
nr:quinol:electron acceptor oxidoreductase subunit ActD [Novosphingobium profundi]